MKIKDNQEGYKMNYLRLRSYLVMLLVFFAIFAVSVNGCNQQKEKEAKKEVKIAKNEKKAEVIKIGAILPLTGNLSFLGTPGKNAIELFRKQNKTSKIEIKLYDSKAEPKTGLTVYRKAYDIDKTNFFITTLTGVSLAIKPVALQQNAFQASIAIYPDIALDSKLNFQFCYNAKKEAEAICSYVKDKGYKDVFIFASRDAVTEIELEKYIFPCLKGSEIKYELDNFDVGSKDFKQIVTKFRASNATQAILLGYGSDFQAILRELANQQALDKTEVIGGIGYLELPNYIEYDLVKTSVFVSPAFLLEGNNNELYKQFNDKYKNIFGVVPTYDAAYTYDTLTALSNALNNIASPSPENVSNYLIKNTIQGVTGPLSFTETGELKVDVVMAKYNSDFTIINVR
jgi:branched-chain amino acid transport system substrate-binding protein